MFQSFIDWLTYSLFGLAPGTPLGGSVNFFLYDVVKIYFLTFGIIAVIAFIRTFLSPHKIRNTLVRQKFLVGNLLASLFGAVTPFCSCSSIPLFIGFLRAELPLGIAFSFIITSPLVNEVVFVLMGSMFGWSIALLYALAGISLGVFAGAILGKMKLEKEVLLKFDGAKDALMGGSYLPRTFEGRLEYSFADALKTFKKLWLAILLGVGLGAVIHGYVPAEFFERYLSGSGFWSVPLATLIGIPIYAGCSTLVPVAFAFMSKGIPLGTVLAFMMSIAGLSLPEAIMLKKIISFKLLALFFGTVAVGIILIGYLFNLFY